MDPSNQIKPFSLQYTTNVPELLLKLNLSLAVSTYQAGKVIILSPRDEEHLIQLPRSFEKAMGIGIEGDKLVLACKDEVIEFRNSADLAKFYPKKQNVYDAMYLPRLTYHTGAIDVHDIDFCDDGIYAVNTNFSCIIKIDSNYSFQPVWHPKFISKVTAGDRCHLNGMAISNGKIKYVSAFAPTDAPRAWKEKLTETGVLIDYKTRDIVLEGLSMPHSPRIYNGKLYVLLSGTGEFIEVDMETYAKRVICKIDAFVRGLAIHEGLAFIGLSKIRKSSSSFGHLDIAHKAKKAGISVVHIESGTVMGNILYNTSVDEIYDVQLLIDKLRPSILNTITEDHKMGLMLPETTFWGKRKEDPNP